MKNWKEVEPKRLDYPESVRTPGRTWTEYEEIEVSEAENLPEIEAEGEVEVLTGRDAVEAGKKRIFEGVKPEENRLTAIHAALVEKPVVVRCTGIGEVKLLHDTNSDVASHVVIETTESAELEVEHEFKSGGRFQSSVVEIYAGQNSTVSYRCLDRSQTELSYCVRKAVANRDSSVKWRDACFGPELSKRRTETALKGDRSSVRKEFLWYPTGKQHFDIELRARHLGRGTNCDMDSIAVVDDSARSVYEGVQKVEETAEDTSSFQDEDVLNLSSDSEVDASPKLMIENPDVEASHAASAGGVDSEKMNYMKSRGIPRDKGRKLIVSGFFEPMIERWDEEFADRIREQIAAKNTE